MRALDDRTVEFRLAAPAPYFMSVMNRPDGGPQPRHAIERDGDAWTETGKQVVSGAFEIAERHPDRLVLRRRRGPRAHPRPGNVATVEYVRQGDPRRDRRLRPRRARRGHRPVHAEDGRPRAGRLGRRAPRRRELVRVPRVPPRRPEDGERRAPAGARQRDRSGDARRARARRTSSWRTAASCRRRCRGTRRTSCRGSIPKPPGSICGARGSHGTT